MKEQVKMINKDSKYRFPFLTLLLSLITVGMYVAYVVLSGKEGVNPELYKQLGAPSAFEVYDGQYWGVVLNSFLHNRIDMLLINLAGLWILGAYIERRLGFHVLFLLGLFASFITSTAQFTLSDDPGIGEMGVNYFLFFFIFIRSFFRQDFKLKYRFVILFALIGLLSWFIYNNQFNNWNIGVVAILSGILLGSIAGFISVSNLKFLNYAFPVIMIGLSTSCFFYAPWSSEWHTHAGIVAHEKNNFGLAKKHYTEALKINKDNKNAANNLFNIELDEIANKAFKLHSEGKYIEARIYYDKVLAKDPNNTWAKEQIKNLP